MGYLGKLIGTFAILANQAPSLFTSIWDIAFWFGLMLNALVNGYGHVGTVNSPKAHFSSWASLTTLKIKQRYLLSLI